jgi:hypothetical protein
VDAAGHYELCSQPFAPTTIGPSPFPLGDNPWIELRSNRDQNRGSESGVGGERFKWPLRVILL